MFDLKRLENSQSSYFSSEKTEVQGVSENARSDTLYYWRWSWDLNAI